MAHPRDRLILNKLLKKLSFFPILALQGARQTGKSFLAKELVQKKLPAAGYFTLDDETLKNRALSHPQSFLLEREDHKPIIIDETQKAPALFDALKLMVDKKRIPGKFLLLGSTEFSILSNIRESLTGRMGKVRVYPMNIQEALSKRGVPTRAQFLKYLRHGGMPGMFSVHSEENQRELVQEWLNLICFRDLQQFKKIALDGELGMRILQSCALLDEPSLAKISEKLKVDSRKIAKHLNAFCELFVLTRLSPHPSGTGKPLFFLLDSGIAGFLGASELRRLEICLLNERYIHHSIQTAVPHFFYYYRSSGKKRIALIEEVQGKGLKAFHLIEDERIKQQYLEIAHAFSNKNGGAGVITLAPIQEKMKFGTLSVFPWEHLAL